MKTPDLQELMFRDEPLNPELEPYVAKSRFGSNMIHSPLIIELFYNPKKAGLVNYQYQYKTEALAKAIQEKDWASYVYIHERPYRFEALKDIADGLTGEEYWKLVGDVWVDSENIFQHFPSWKAIWSKPTEGFEATMDEDEKAKLESLPDTIEVYRGTNYRKAAKGLSWTLDKDKAIWFARRWLRKRRKPYLVYGEVKKADVRALFLGRNESEIVSPYVKVKKIEILE